MSDIIEFKKKEDTDEVRIWECGCGGRLFFLYEDGYVRCNTCDEVSPSMKCFMDEKS